MLHISMLHKAVQECGILGVDPRFRIVIVTTCVLAAHVPLEEKSWRCWGKDEDLGKMW